MNSGQVEDIYELAPLQQGMLFHSLLAPESGLYFEQLCFELHGVLDLGAFERAWKRVIERHAVLRSAVQWEGLEKPYQLVYREVEAPLQWLDWMDVSEREQEERLSKWLAEDRSRGFTFSEAPLLRLTLIGIAPKVHQFIWSLHHLVLDGWSWPLVMRELLTIYGAFTRNEEVDLREPRPYREYIEWLQKQDTGRAEKFWKDYLGGFTTPTTISAGGTGSKDVAKPDYDRRRMAFSEETTRALGLVTAGQQVTLSTLVKTAWALLLSRYSGEDDVLLGSVVAGRPPLMTGVEQMVGFFMNTLPLRVRISPGQRVAELLRQVQADDLECREYEYSSLVDVQSWSELPNGVPLFESVLAFENYPFGETAAANEGIEILNLRAYDLTNYPLTVSAVPGRELRVEIIFDRTRFDGETIERILEHLKILLEAIAVDPQMEVLAVPLLSGDELHKVLVEWNDTAAETPGEVSLHGLVEQFAATTPDACALTFGAEQLSYFELNARANRMAHYLAAHGVGPEVRVGVCLHRSVDLIVAILAIAKAGGAWLSLDSAYPAERLSWMCGDSGILLLVTEHSLAPLFDGERARLLEVDGRRSEIAQESAENFAGAAGPRNAAYMIYTSGSTGQPKGMVIERRSFSMLAAAQRSHLGLTAADRVPQFASPSFDASVFEMGLAFTVGATLVLANADELKTGASLYELLRRERISAFCTPPSAMASLPGTDLPALQTLFLCGEACSAELVERWASGRRMFNLYGPTEATIWSTYEVCHPGMGRPSIGRPVNNVRIYLLDNHLRPVPIGASGEMYIGGAMVGRGYHNRPELNLERFIADPFTTGPDARLFRTGDVARYLRDGRLEYVGRIDNQVKLRGFRIELGEIESLLARHEAVVEAVVIVREDRPGDKRLVAYVTPTRQDAGLGGGLRSYLKSKLPQFMVPAFVFLETMPKTTSGKVDKRALPAPERIDASGGTFAPPQSEMEEKIAAVWRDVLRLERVGRDDNFFDLGGHSLLVTRVYGELRQFVEQNFSIVDLFRYPTISSLAKYLRREEEAPVESAKEQPVREASAAEPIAIIGMAGRFPDAANVDELWRNLRAGVEGVRFFSDDELIAAGATAAELADPDYVRAGTILEGRDQFDAAFFGFSPREAAITDPQHRLFLECAHEALETAGYGPQTCEERIGVFAGSTISSYFIKNLLSDPDVISSAEAYQTLIGNDKDFIATKLSYKLNLKGPAVTVQTACSTSLVAVHMACRSLLNDEAEIALAGGVSISLPQPAGYVYQAGGIGSPDGHCRVFDADAAGTYSGSGLGIVVLKRLSAALADGDTIHAVIRGTAINNDGSNKIGYTAPSVEGQAAVIVAAQKSAGVEPRSITYVEAHGTGTRLGDPIEMAALNQAFAGTQERGFCAVGSLKSNFGHLDAAAGVAGLIKTALQLKHRELVPSLHFKRANPVIDFENSPFFVNADLRDWTAGEWPRRAGVSSFGIGGTNAHVVLEEAPEMQPGAAGREWQVLPLSAKTETALEKAGERLREYLQSGEGSLADAAYTLQAGRTAHAFRRAIVCREREDAIEALGGHSTRAMSYSAMSREKRPVAFLFPGQGAQYAGMGHGLYQNEPVFRAAIDRCAELLKPHGNGRDLREVLHPKPELMQEAEAELQRTATTQPALFAVEYALAQLWMEWGIHPECMIGHSIGEYVAACIAGVLSLEDAIRLVAVRGRVMQEMEAGAMLAIEATEAEAARLAGDSLDVAVVNAPRMCVLSGAFDVIAEAEKKCDARGIGVRRLRTSHAFHSRMMEPALKAFGEAVKSVKLAAPKIPYVSNLTGTWISAAEAIDPEYWAAHLRSCVRFSAGVGEILAAGERVLLEVGPGQSLTTFAREHTAFEPGRILLQSMGTAREKRPDPENILGTIARLWVAGVTPDWRGFHAHERRRRIPLPGYPFERNSYWIEGCKPAERKVEPRATTAKDPDISNWFYAPSWRRSAGINKGLSGPAARWLVYQDDRGVADEVVRMLREAGHSVTCARPGERVAGLASAPEHVVYLSALCGETGSLEDSFYGVTSVIQFLDEEWPGARIRLSVVTANAQDVTGEEQMNPWHATVLGPCTVVQQEHPNVSCRVLDFERRQLGAPGRTARAIVDETLSETTDRVVAFRGAHRWVQAFERQRLDETGKRPAAIRERGVYLITGGLGKIGLALAEYLAHTCRARLVLISRTVPSSADALRRLEHIRSLGAELRVVTADVADEDAMRRAVENTVADFGVLHGVIHAAGPRAQSDLCSLRAMDREIAERHFDAKVHGVVSVEKATRGRELDFCLVLSSLSSMLGGVTFGAYAAANAFLDAFVHAQNREGAYPWISVNFDAWNFEVPTTAVSGSGLASFAMSKEEGIEVFRRIFGACRAGQVVVSTANLDARLNEWTSAKAETVPEKQLYARPELQTPYEEPRNEIDVAVIRIWQHYLGVEKIGISDNFFDLGGHSLTATRVFAQLRDTFKTDLPLREFFEAATVSELSDKIIAYEPAPGFVEKIIRVRAMVENMSEQDVAVALQGKSQEEQFI